MSPVHVELVTRRGCHLCDDALAALRELGVEPRLSDVDSDAELSRLYDFRVPVILLEGRVIAEGSVDLATLRRTLAAS